MIGIRVGVPAQLPIQNGSITDAGRIFRAMTTPPTPARKILIAALIADLKTAGSWALMDCFYVTAAADSQAATINWKNPGNFTLVPTNSPAFVADRGFTGDGATSYLSTQFNPVAAAGNYSLNNSSYGVFIGTNSVVDAQDMAQLAGGTTLLRARQTGDTASIRLNDGAAVTGAVTTSIGHTAGSRVSAASKFLYRNGAQIGTSATASSSVTSSPFTLLRSSATFSTHQVSAAHVSASLSAAQMLSLSNSLITYLTAVGAPTT